MTTWMPITLGFIQELFAVIVIIMVIGSAIKNATAKRPNQGGGSAGRTTGGGAGRTTPRGQAGGGSPTADELAARRRAQLEELARRRQARVGGQGGGQASRPSAPPLGPDTSMGERQQLEAQRRAQAERAEAMRRQAQAAEQERARAAEEARRRQTEIERRRQLAAQQRAQEEAARRQQAEQRQRRLSSIEDRPAPGSRLGQGVTLVDEDDPHVDLDTGMSTVHRHVPDADTPYAIAHVRKGKLRITRDGLRQAIILKELLDRPVSMREG